MSELGGVLSALPIGAVLSDQAALANRTGDELGHTNDGVNELDRFVSALRSTWYDAVVLDNHGALDRLEETLHAVLDVHEAQTEARMEACSVLVRHGACINTFHLIR